MRQNNSTSRQKSKPKKEPSIPAESELAISDEEIARLTSIIVPNEACEQLYESDEIALALIRLIAGLMPEGHRHDTALEVAMGMFRRTYTHNKALDEFVIEGLRFNPEKLKSVEERTAELRELRRRM